MALGRRPAADLPPVEYVECATEWAVIEALHEGRRRVWRSWTARRRRPVGWGSAAPIKQEVFQAPPVLVVIGRPQDQWLAAWSRADGVVSHPIDPIATAAAAAELLRGQVAGGVASWRRRCRRDDVRHEPTWPAVLGALIRREDLDTAAAQWAMAQVMAGDATPRRSPAFAVALRARGRPPRR